MISLLVVKDDSGILFSREVQTGRWICFCIEPTPVSRWNGAGTANSFRPINNEENSKPNSHTSFSQRSDTSTFGGTDLAEYIARDQFDLLARSERGGLQSGVFRSGNDGNSRGN